MNTPKDLTGNRLLGIASALLIVLAVAQGYVSFAAQYGFVLDVKEDPLASVLEALGLDIGAVIFALLAIASARLGRRAVTERLLNVACAAGALAMNAMSANSNSPKELAVYVMPSLLYIAASDRLIAVVRQRVLAPLVEPIHKSPAEAAEATPEVEPASTITEPSPPSEKATEPVEKIVTETALESAEEPVNEVVKDDVTTEAEPARSAFEIDPEYDGLTDEEAIRKTLGEIGLDSSVDDVRGFLALRGRLVHEDTVMAVQEDEQTFQASADEFLTEQESELERVAAIHVEKVTNPFG